MIKQWEITAFNERHDCTEDQQFKQLIEEVGELAEAYNRDATDEQIAAELGDVIFVARSLAELRTINVEAAVNTTIHENSQKDESTDGQKVTKEGLDDST